MSDERFVLTMLYAGHHEPNIRCELFLRHLPKQLTRVERVELLRGLLWLLIALVALVAFWFAVGYAAVTWL